MQPEAKEAGSHRKLKRQEGPRTTVSDSGGPPAGDSDFQPPDRRRRFCRSEPPPRCVELP